MKFDETYPHIADWIKNRNSISMQEINVGLYAVSASEESTVAVLLSFTDVESVHRETGDGPQYIATEEVTDEAMAHRGATTLPWSSATVGWVVLPDSPPNAAGLPARWVVHFRWRAAD